MVVVPDESKGCLCVAGAVDDFFGRRLVGRAVRRRVLAAPETGRATGTEAARVTGSGVCRRPGGSVRRTQSRPRTRRAVSGHVTRSTGRVPGGVRRVPGDVSSGVRHVPVYSVADGRLGEGRSTVTVPWVFTRSGGRSPTRVFPAVRSRALPGRIHRRTSAHRERPGRVVRRVAEHREPRRRHVGAVGRLRRVVRRLDELGELCVDGGESRVERDGRNGTVRVGGEECLPPFAEVGQSPVERVDPLGHERTFVGARVVQTRGPHLLVDRAVRRRGARRHERRQLGTERAAGAARRRVRLVRSHLGRPVRRPVLRRGQGRPVAGPRARQRHGPGRGDHQDEEEHAEHPDSGSLEPVDGWTVHLDVLYQAERDKGGGPFGTVRGREQFGRLVPTRRSCRRGGETQPPAVDLRDAIAVMP